MMAKTTVIGTGANALYRQLEAATGQRPGWNFHKYLIGRDGKTVKSFDNSLQPQAPALVGAIEKALAGQ